MNPLLANNPNLQNAFAAAKATGLLGGFSTASLILGLVFSTLGVFYIRHGRKQERMSSLLAGFALTLYPWFVYRPWPLTLIGLGLAAIPLVF